jgi:hypothetical protein
VQFPCVHHRHRAAGEPPTVGKLQLNTLKQLVMTLTRDVLTPAVRRGSWTVQRHPSARRLGATHRALAL